MIKFKLNMKLATALIATAWSKRLTNLAQLSSEPTPNGTESVKPPTSSPVSPPGDLEEFSLEALAEPGSTAYRGFRDWDRDEFDCYPGDDEPQGGNYFDTDQYSPPSCRHCGSCGYTCDCAGEPDCECDDLDCDNVCDFVPEVDECILEDLIADNPPGGPDGGNSDDNSGELGSASGSIKTEDITDIE